MLTIDSLHWWLSLRRNACFWDWMKDTYSLEELRRLTFEATECTLVRPPNPLADAYLYDGRPEAVVLREVAHRLYNRYYGDIWSICLGAGGHDPDMGQTGLGCLATLDLSSQVSDQETFEEFMVRNAMKRAARQVLERREASGGK